MACLQESKLNTASSYTDFPRYSSLQRDRSDGRGGGGFLTLIHHDVNYTKLNTVRHFPRWFIHWTAGLHNYSRWCQNKHRQYLPSPTSCCPIGYRPSLQELLASHDKDTLIVGDFNAYNSAWFSKSGSDHAITRGTVINSLINDSNLTLMNENTTTRVTQDGSSSSPDLTIDTPHLRLGSVWNLVTTLNFDHMQIIIKPADWFPDPPPRPKPYVKKHKES